MKKNNTLYNKQGQRHGYWESYWSDGKLCHKGNYIRGKSHGYWEYYWSDGQLWYKGNYINGKEDGLWMWDDCETINFYL